MGVYAEIVGEVLNELKDQIEALGPISDRNSDYDFGYEVCKDKLEELK